MEGTALVRLNFFGFSLRDEMVQSYSEADGIAVRARLALNQDDRAEDLYWQWQHDQERTQGTEILADICGFTAAGQTGQENALGLYASVMGPWLAVIETSLDLVDYPAFRRVMDFVERERPAGMQVYVAGSGASFTVPEYHAIYLNTGEVVDIASDVVLAMPLAY